MRTFVSTDLSGGAPADVSFQSSTANAWGKSFLAHLGRELHNTTLPDTQLVKARICRLSQTLFNAQVSSLSEVTSYTALGMCGLLFTAYRELRHELGNPGRAFGIVERSFDLAYRAFIQNICKPLLLTSNYPTQALRKMNFKAWSEHLYATGVRGQGRPATTGYQQFFQQHGEPALARIIQVADQAWLEAVAACRHSPLSDRRLEPAGSAADANGDGFSPFHFAHKAVLPPEPKARPHEVLELQVKGRSSAAGRERRASSAARIDRRRHCSGLDGRQSERRGGARDWSLRDSVDRRASSQA